MADARRGEDDERGPGEVYRMFDIMSDLIEKLKLLNYEEHFLKKNNIKSIARHYFAISTNPGEQFYVFTSLCAWLINVAGRPFDMPQEYDDPNATISNILDEVRRLGVGTDFPPSKLKTGSGEFVCYILDQLATCALESTQFYWNKPVYPEEEQNEDENIEVEDQGELKLDEVETEAVNAADDSDEEGGGAPFFDLGSSLSKTGKSFPKQSEIMHSTTNADDWKLEVERVTSSLKVTIRTDNKDWRNHTDQMHQYKVGIEKSLADAKPQLDKLQEEIKRTLEKIASREKYINNQLEQKVHEYRSAQDRLAEANEKYKKASGGATEYSRTLAELTEELEGVKLEMEERGNSMTDGAPLVKIKQTLSRLKTESIQMGIRIGVIEHVLMQARMRDKTSDINKSHLTPGHVDALDEDADKDIFIH
ncbi:intraflagellar transport protein 57 homolog [Clavelina lepadiformis]|uniref:Intraflagellar transport protein 57 homolog n=1 Tax=Clavelina lepadiformis TaxID=159417 RepID=A0ABP0F261_CLALP